MRLTLDRVAVCAADDCIAHIRQLQVDDHSTLRSVLDAVKVGDYLAGVGNASWLVSLGVDGPLVALVAEQWRDAVLLVSESSTVEELGDQLFFHYLVQREPVAVLAALVDAMALERIEPSTDGLLAVPLAGGPRREPTIGWSRGWDWFVDQHPARAANLAAAEAACRSIRRVSEFPLFELVNSAQVPVEYRSDLSDDWWTLGPRQRCVVGRDFPDMERTVHFRAEHIPEQAAVGHSPLSPPWV